MLQPQSQVTRFAKAPAAQGRAMDWFASLLITLLAMLVIEVFSREFRAFPAPAPILLLAVVYSAFTGGIRAGLGSALLVILYQAWFFSTQPEGWQNQDHLVRLATLATSAPVMALMVGMLRRNAKRNETEQAIRRSERRYRSLVSAAAQVVWTTNARGEVIEHLPTWAAFTGQTLDEMKGFGWNRAVHPDDVERVSKAWQQSLYNKTPHDNDFRVRRADGQWREVHSRAVPVLEPDGMVREWVGTLKDVTEERQASNALIEQKEALKSAATENARLYASAQHELAERERAQRALHEAEERLRLSVQSAGIGTWDFDPITGQLQWSDRCKAIFGLPADASISYDAFIERVDQDDRDRVNGAVRDALGTPDKCLFESEYRVHWPDGTMHWVSARGRAFFEIYNGAMRAFRFIGTALDVTHRKQAELGIRRAKEEAEAANRAKDQFLAALSHELRTPLTPVLLTAAAMENDPALPDEVRRQGALIRRNVDLEARLIDDLLDLTRVSRGKLQLHLRPIDPVLTLNAAVEVCQDELTSKGVRLTSCSHSHDRHVQADPARLQQVFWNLIKNAVKFTPTGGEVHIECDSTEDRWWMTITDTGIGIDPEMLPKIFDAFEQGADGINRQFGGLGLGLAISKAVVEMHGGKLSVSSEGKGRGSTFKVELPATTAAVPAPSSDESPAQSRRADSRPLRILLVEDHDATSHVISLLLRQLQHKVTAAPTLAEARKHADADHFDLLISDLGLPDGSGLDLMRELRAKFNLTGICLSGYGMDQDITLSREAGFARHLIKPVDFRHLKATIESVTS
jgi:PAS domain S-box-containing protein